MGQAWIAAEKGNDIIDHYGSLHLASRAIQEEEMQKLDYLVTNAHQHLAANTELCGDISEPRRIEAVPKFRGNSHGAFRVRGLHRNPNEQVFMMEKLLKYVGEKKMFVCTSKGIPLPNQYCCSPSTTVAKKLPYRTLSPARNA